MKVIALHIPYQIDNSIVKLLIKKISSEKQKRILRFIFWQDLQRSLFADLLIRKTIIESYDLSNEKIHFETNEYGKPYCKELEDFNFNVSHSGDWVVAAIDSCDIGIDIEKISTIDLEISKNFFSDREHEDLMLSSDPFDYFFTLWSLKESYIKYLGKGLSQPLDSFSIRANNPSKIRVETNDESLKKKNEGLFFRLYNLEKGYKMAVCGQNLTIPEKPIIYSIDDLIQTFAPSYL